MLALLVQLSAQHALAHSQPNAKSVTSQITITWTGLLASSALRGTILLVHLVYLAMGVVRHVGRRLLTVRVAIQQHFYQTTFA